MTATGKRPIGRERTVTTNGNKPQITRKEFEEALQKVSRKLSDKKTVSR